MSAKKEKDIELKKQEELEKMLGISLDDSSNTIAPIINQNSSNNTLPLNTPNVPNPDLMKDLKEAEDEAESIVTSVIDFYFEDDLARNLDAIKSKKHVEVKTLTNILFQQKTQRHAIMKLSDEIYSGGHVNIARLYEVLEKLQTSMMNTVKHQTAYMDVLYSSFKKLKEDQEKLDSLKMNPNLQLPDGDLKKIGEGIKTRGTKELIESLKQEVEDIKFEEIGTSLTDAKMKYDEEQATEKKELENNTDEIIDNDLF